MSGPFTPIVGQKYELLSWAPSVDREARDHVHRVGPHGIGGLRKRVGPDGLAGCDVQGARGRVRSGLAEQRDGISARLRRAGGCAGDFVTKANHVSPTGGA